MTPCAQVDYETSPNRRCRPGWVLKVPKIVIVYTTVIRCMGAYGPSSRSCRYTQTGHLLHKRANQHDG